MPHSRQYAAWLKPLRTCERTCARHRHASEHAIDRSSVGETGDGQEDQVRKEGEVGGRLRLSMHWLRECCSAASGFTYLEGLALERAAAQSPITASRGRRFTRAAGFAQIAIAPTISAASQPASVRALTKASG